MPLEPNDPKPVGISVDDAYNAIRDWYRANAPRIAEDPAPEDSRMHPAARASLPLVDALPPVSALTEVEIRAVLSEVILGRLEWGYHESDGRFKMGDYAQTVQDQAVAQRPMLTDEQQRELRQKRDLYAQFSTSIVPASD